MKLPRLWPLTNLRALLIIGFAGVATYASGLGNQFVGDDFSQVVGNPAVHSLSRIPHLFSGSTFYNGPGSTALAGVYFKPLMSITYALIYNAVGAQAYWFHLVQLLGFIAAVWLLFLFLRDFFRPGLALFLCLMFLVHPLNSQSVFGIADLQEVLYFMFGMLALWLLTLRRQAKWVAPAAAACLLLSMLSKETGLCFGALAIIYAIMFNRRRVLAVTGWSLAALVIYLTVKIPAVGLLANPGNAPIDRLSLPARLLNVPALYAFYLGKLVWPQHVAHAYYWVIRGPSLVGFWLPLAVIIGIVALLTIAGRAASRRSPRAGRVYVFFAVWTAAGLLFHSQIQPLDLTISLPWFMLPFVGLLGLTGVLIQTFALEFLLLPVPRRALTAAAVLLLAMLAARTAVRGMDWSGTYTLAARDLAVSAEDYPSANLLADRANAQGRYAAALPLAHQSVAVYPTAVNLDTLGVAEAGLHHCAAADRDFARSLSLANTTFARRDRAQAAVACGSAQTSVK